MFHNIAKRLEQAVKKLPTIKDSQMYDEIENIVECLEKALEEYDSDKALYVRCTRCGIWIEDLEYMYIFKETYCYDCIIRLIRSIPSVAAHINWDQPGNQIPYKTLNEIPVENLEQCPEKFDRLFMRVLGCWKKEEDPYDKSIYLDKVLELLVHNKWYMTENPYAKEYLKEALQIFQHCSLPQKKLEAVIRNLSKKYLHIFE